MKKLFVVMSMVALSACAFAGPHGCPGGWRPGPYPHHYHHHGHGDWWGRGGRNFWPGFVGGVVGGVVASSIVSPAPVVVTQPVVTTPVVVTQPTVVAQPVVAQPVVTQPVVQQTVVSQPVSTTQSVWVEGRYVDTVQANGTVVRTWQPGHYEQRTVIVQ